jgi:hypothetical protein
MKKISILALCAGLTLCTVNTVFANRALWSVEGAVAPSQNPKKFLPKAYKIIQLDHVGIKQLLAKAGTSFETGVTIDIPTPHGTFKTFKVWNTPVMEDELAAQYPEIQTYTGSLVGDPSQTIKLSMTPMGFTARTFAFDMDDVMAIESYGYEAKGYYTLAAGKDLYQSPVIGCNPEALGSIIDSEPITINESREKIAQRTFGNVRRTYRLALACTGDYALAVSGTPNPTVSQILAIMNSMVNNANGVWEREVSISTKLVNNNTAVIYLDPMTDPFFDDTDHGTVINENQDNHDIFIGNANYDLGHVLTAQLGGLAQLASVCAPGSKARGVSGSTGPTDIGTITHEVGHQMGAGHTFTSATGGCNGNGMATSSVEPGSGTTIMSYNGSCGADNTPLFTNPLTDYYNQFNLNEMQQVLTSSGTCGTTALGQTPVNMPNINLRYIIPNNTPFELIAAEATNTVTANSAPVYCWEQNDLGPINMVEAQGGNATAGPIFMSMPSRLSRYREFPRYETLADGDYSASGERLPMGNRNMRFKVTARSISQDGWGTTNTIEDHVNIKVVQSGEGDFRVTDPADPNLNLQPNEKFEIKWNIGNTLKPEDSIMTGSVNIYLSIDGGLSFPIILATNVPNNGTYLATAPNYFATNARVKVKAVGNIYFDVSKVGFRINGTVGVKPVDVSSSISVYPNPATDIINIKNTDFTGEALEMVMLNVLGQEVWTGKMEAHTTISTSGLAKGAYYIHFKSAKSGKFGVHKVIVK